jgi:hypothetical protein
LLFFTRYGSPTDSRFRYDSHGQSQAFGAEARAIDDAEAEEKGWQLAKHFKLHLHPPTMQTRSALSLDPLPEGVTIEKIYSDFFKYLYGHTQAFFTERELQGTKVWQELTQKKEIEFVIAHPNGWTLQEQAFLRKAAVNAGLTSQSDAPQMVHMLTEAEASVHFVMFRESVGSRLEVGECH